MNQLAYEADVWALASHYCWGLWGLIQAKISSIDDFDFMAFGMLRLRAAEAELARTIPIPIA